MKEEHISYLMNHSLNIRSQILRMSTNGGSFIGASFSFVDILTYLYFEYLDVKDKTHKDYFFLSKGHGVPALYATLAERGYIASERLQNHLKENDFIYWHPNINIPKVDYHSGSLGHLVSVAIGVALDMKIKRVSRYSEIMGRVFPLSVVLLGDGELNEGSNWEGFLLANAQKLNNLLVIIDRNSLQANCKTEELIPLEPLERKLESFGFNVYNCNGHCFDSLNETFESLSFSMGRPNVIIADTVRGKGIQILENNPNKWFCNFTEDEIQSLTEELKNAYYSFT